MIEETNNEKQKAIFVSKTIRAFLSYEREHDNEYAGALKRNFENYGINAFVAHDDMLGALSFIDQIKTQLDQCDIFVPIISEHYRTSLWTDQETGYAFAKGKKICPIKKGENPHGFIRDIQAFRLKATKKTFDDGRYSIDCRKTIEDIINTLLLEKKFRESIKHCLIRAFGKSYSFDDAGKKTNLLKIFIDEFQDEEIYELIQVSINNVDIYQCLIAQNFLKEVINKYGNILPEEDINELLSLFY